MHVDDTGHDELAPEVHDLGRLPGRGLNIVVRSDRQELAVLDGNSLRPGLGLVDGVDPPVRVDGIGDVPGRRLRASDGERHN